MLKEKVRDIEILYLEDDADAIEAVKLVIDRNYLAISNGLKAKRVISLYETDDPNIYSMYDFEVEFHKLIKKFLSCPEIKEILEKASLVDWYLYFFRSSLAENYIYLNVDIGCDLEGSYLEEIFNILVRYRYYQENGTIEEFLSNQLSSGDADKLFDWLQDKVRYPLYNKLLKMMINELQTDEFLFKNFEKLYLIICEQVKNEVNCELEFDLPKMSRSEIDNLMYEFFDYIKAPKYWKMVYDELNRKGDITFIDDHETKEKTTFYFDGDTPKIQIVCTGRIDDFTALVHEFIHYLYPVYQEEFPLFIIREIPSIYFEIMASKFLVSKGYSKDIESFVYDIHYADNYLCSIELSTVIFRMLDFMTNGPTSFEKEYSDLKKGNERSIRSGTYSLLEFNKEDVLLKASLNTYIDGINNCFLNFGIMHLSGIQYILAILIIERIMEKEDTKDIMLDIASNLGSYNLEKIMNMFDIKLFEEAGQKYLTKKRD